MRNNKTQQEHRSKIYCEINVLNWSKAWFRAKTPKSRKHAKKMLRHAVEHLEAKGPDAK